VSVLRDHRVKRWVLPRAWVCERKTHWMYRNRRGPLLSHSHSAGNTVCARDVSFIVR